MYRLIHSFALRATHTFFSITADDDERRTPHFTLHFSLWTGNFDFLENCSTADCDYDQIDFHTRCKYLLVVGN